MHLDRSPSPPNTLAEELVRLLRPPLERRGLALSVRRDGLIDICNPVGHTAADPQIRALTPALRQRIALREHEGGWWWHWAWDGPTGDAPHEYEPMAQADEVEEAARRLGNVLRVDDYELPAP